MKLTVVIVNYNVCYYVEQCLESVFRATKGMESEIFVVDNASSDGSVDYLRQKFAKQITLIECQHNLGFARANNIAIRQSTGEYVLLLNPDTFVSEDALQQAVKFMDAHPKAGGVGAMMHNSNGTLARESRRAIPTPWVSLLKMLGFSKRYYMSHLSWDQPACIEAVSGAFFMVRREAMDAVGMLDKDYFMYGEDIDLSYRILKGGYENWYVPARIVHYKGESTIRSSYRYVHVFYDAMLIFFRKHYSHLSFLVTVPIKMAIYFRAFIALIFMLTDKMRTSLGFDRKRHVDMVYVYRGPKATRKKFIKLANRKGLTMASEAQSLPYCEVYDVESASFNHVITEAEKSQKALIGTFYPSKNLLITPNDIIK